MPRTEGMTHINDILPGAIAEIDSRFHERAQAWRLTPRNQAITARNRNMRKIAGMLGMEYRELPLEQVEEVEA